MATTTTRNMLTLAAVAGALFATVAGAAPKPSWQAIPVGVDQRGVFFAAGRAWYYSGIESGSFRTKSARVANGRLSGWTTATLPGTRGWAPIRPHGQELLFSTPRDGVQAVKLLPSGRFGARRAFDTGAPPPAYSTGSSVIQLPDRVVQLVNACDYVEPPAKPCRDREIRTGACCDVDGDGCELRLLREAHASSLCGSASIAGAGSGLPGRGRGKSTRRRSSSSIPRRSSRAGSRR